MKKKGSMELSVNSIVILVIAIVMLGLILGFVRSKFGDLNKQFVQNEPDAPTASSSEPITLSRPSIVVNSGEQLGLKFQVYALADIASTDKPAISCTGTGAPTFTIEVNGKIASQGETIKYESLTTVSSSAAKGKYLCKVKMSTAAWPVTGEKDIIVEVQ